MSISEDFCQHAETAFIDSWCESMLDYAHKRINSEKCFQAILFSSIRNKLSAEYTIYVEATIWLPDGRRQYIDLLICRQNLVVAAIELKYKPKAELSKIGMYSDLEKLLNLRNYKSRSARIAVEVKRFLGKSKTERETFLFAPNRRIIFAGYCRADKIADKTDSFWKAHRSALSGPASRRNTIPPKLMICLARTEAGLSVTPQLLGGKHIQTKLPPIAIDA